MNRVLKWLLGIAAVIVLALAGVALALKSWVGSDDFRLRVAKEVSAAAGVPVELGGLTVDVWPLPAVAVERAVVKSNPPLSFERIEARPVWSGLLQKKLEISTLYVRNAVISQDAIAAVAAAYKKAHPDKAKEKKPAGEATVQLPQRIVLDKVTWVDTKNQRSVIDATARIDDDGLPAQVDIEVSQGRWEGVQAKLQRTGNKWALKGQVGGGTITGRFETSKNARSEPQLQGEFDTANVEVSTFTAPSKTLTGRLEAHTNVQANLKDLGALPDVLQSQTKFTIRNAVVHGIDLQQAVKTVGMNRGGETRLDTLAGQLVTRGRAAELNNLVASSGALSATGHVTMSAEKNLGGNVNVNLAEKVAGQALGVPLVVGGTLDSPSVTLSRAALAGAAIGTLIAPGPGTAAGANLGDKLKGLFGK
ncbi:hypothetical protein [Ramlibacter sp. PS4R-6]|uniref:hypothetical protein n=1 Tax=Ramlibacter sp. PS4R-6 TaxID=3133438 RepID=UPI0030B6AC68